MSSEGLTEQELLILRLNLSLVLALKIICKTDKKSVEETTYSIAEQAEITLRNLSLEQQQDILNRAKEYNDICDSFNVIESDVENFLKDQKAGK